MLDTLTLFGGAKFNRCSASCSAIRSQGSRSWQTERPSRTSRGPCSVMLLQRLQIGRHSPVHAHDAFNQPSLPTLASSCHRRWGCGRRSAPRWPCSHRRERSCRSGGAGQTATSLVASAAITVASEAQPASSAANEFATWLQDLPWTKIATWATVGAAASILVDFFGVSNAPGAHAYVWQPR
jgi:hypothetical protein